MVSLASETESLKKETYTLMRRVIEWTEQFQHYAEELKEGFWGDLYGLTAMVWKQRLEEESAWLRHRYLRLDPYERSSGEREDYRNGFYYRDFVTRLGTLRLKLARTRKRSFLPPGVERFQRRAAGGGAVVRGGLLRGVLKRQGGRGGGILTHGVGRGQPVS